MYKSKQLNNWLWKWHIIAGLVSVPIMVLLSITGAIYLFKSNYNDYRYQDQRFVSVDSTLEKLSYQEQLQAAKSYSGKPIMSVTLSQGQNQATQFRERQKGHARNLVYVNPYTNQITGTYQQKQSLMYTIRKLHGELLLKTPGTLVVELVASWFVVLFLTGIYVWWPFKKFSMGGLFSIRTKETKRILWRDLHSVLGFWVSVFMLIIIAGGMPWTDVFGDQLKWVQKKTNTGYPQYWKNSKGLESVMPAEATKPLNLDQVVTIAKQKNLKGEVTIKLPKNATGVYTIKNRAFLLRDQQVIHLDQYSGEAIKSLVWQDVGILMVLRQVFMRLHQGEYGIVNLVVALVVTLIFMFSTIASLVSYLIRKPKGRWGLPKVPDGFNIGLPLLFAIIGLGILFPMFGASLIAIFVIEKTRSVFSTQKVETINQN